MQLCHTNQELSDAVDKAKQLGSGIGFIPTMGALHEGHLSLIRQAQKDNHFVVVSIFVNPLQFGEASDFDSYPRTLGVDARLLNDAGVDVLYAPSVQEVFPKGVNLPEPAPGRLGEGFEGEARPGHFAGMLKAVSRLFDLVRADAAYFGQKDAQQLALVKQMVAEQISDGMREPMSVIACPTIRDESGLALSSRNQKLSQEELAIAQSLSRALFAARDKGGTRDEILSAARAELSGEARLDYLELVDPTSFEKVDKAPGLLLIAAWIGKVRLIDNQMIGQ
jgi:pantoate--beta-alanine ligase